jgi:hypothetical protein
VKNQLGGAELGVVSIGVAYFFSKLLVQLMTIQTISR